MSKSIELTASQIKALENGANVFIIPIELEENRYRFDSIDECVYTGDCQAVFYDKNDDDYLHIDFPVQKGDEFFIQEDFCELSELLSSDFSELVDKNPSKNIGLYVYKNQYKEESLFTGLTFKWTNASQMQEHQSRYRSECVDVRVIRVHDKVKSEEAQAINPLLLNFRMFIDFYNDQLKEQNINRTYEDNDYLFLVQTKGIEK